MKKNNVCWMGFGLLAIVLWCNGAYWFGRVEGMTRSVLVKWQEGGVSPSTLIRQEKYLKQDGADGVPEVTLWEETPYGEVRGEDKERTATATVVELFGHVQDVCEEESLLGGYPIRGDDKGCVISEQTAFDLWGSREVLGKTIHMDQGSYYVYGVVKGKDGLVAVQSNEAGTRTFPNMQIRFPDGGYREDAEAYLKKMGFVMDNADGVRILDAPLLQWFLQLVCFLPALCLGVWIIVRWIGLGIRFRLFPITLAYTIPITVFFMVVLGKICVGSLDGVPARLIPTRWSDFEFWGSFVEEGIEHIRTWMAHPTGRDVTLSFSVLSSILAILSTLVFLVVSVSHIRIRSFLECLTACMVLMGMVFVMTAVYRNRGGMKVNIGMWWMPVIGMVTDYGIFIWRRQLPFFNHKIRRGL